MFPSDRASIRLALATRYVQGRSADFSFLRDMAESLQESRTTEPIESAFERHPRPQKAIIRQSLIPTKRALAQASQISDVRSNTSPPTLFTRPPSPPSSASLPLPRPYTSPRSSHSLSLIQVQYKCPWSENHLLGTLVQGENEFLLCAPRSKHSDLTIFKKYTSQTGEKEAEHLQKLSHHNIIKLKQLCKYDGVWYLGFEFYQFTLEEVLHVHLDLEESHIQLISQSVNPQIG